jgi:phosphoserine phosphatase
VLQRLVFVHLMSPPLITLEVSVASQLLWVLRDGVPIRRFRVSTASAGIGSVPGSLCTPVGHFAVSEKIGGGQPSGTIFRSRLPVGCWTPEQQTAGDLILTRILRLEGLDAQNANTAERYIYLHGTNDEAAIGSPASHGCIRLTNNDIIELFELVPVGSPLLIYPHSAPPMKVAFFDCDSTLSAIEGVDELARLRGPDVFAEVEALTNAAMNGEIPIQDVFARRLDIIQPSLSVCTAVAQAYIQRIEPHCLETLNILRQNGWTLVILSGGFLPVIEPFAKFLNISAIEAVPLDFHADGSYAGFDPSYPTTRNGGKPEVIEKWKQRTNPQKVIMVGDGVSDLETASVVDLFIGYGGVVARSHVQEAAPVFIHSLAELPGILETHLAIR